MAASAKLFEIERLRGIAVLMVIFHHMQYLCMRFPSALQSTWAGVDLFFVISGFVVTLSLARLLPEGSPAEPCLNTLHRAAPALKVFFTRRFFRLYPMSMIWMVLPLLASIFFNHSGIFRDPLTLVKDCFGILTISYNYKQAFDKGLLSYYWSLSVEEQFYLILPFMFLLLGSQSRRFAGTVLAIIIIGCLVRPLAPYHGPAEREAIFWRFASHARFDSLFAGVALALYASGASGPPKSRTLKAWCIGNGVTLLALLLIALYPGLAPTSVVLTVGFTILWALSAIVVYLASQNRGYVLDFPLIGPLAAYIGSRSYGLYLIHMPVQWTFEEFKFRYPQAFSFVATPNLTSALLRSVIELGIAIALAEVFFRVVEQPGIAAGARLIRSWNPPAPAQSQPVNLT